MSEAIEKFLSEHKNVPCTCGMDDNMHETTCAKYEWALAWYEVGQLRARAAEADALRAERDEQKQRADILDAACAKALNERDAQAKKLEAANRCADILNKLNEGMDVAMPRNNLLRIACRMEIDNALAAWLAAHAPTQGENDKDETR